MSSARVKYWRIVLISVGLAILLFGVLLLAWDSRIILFTNTLNVAAFTNHQGDYSADALDSNNNRVASIFVRFPMQVYGGLTEIPTMVSIWHQLGTKLDSLEVTFSSTEFLTVSLSAPEGYPWPSLEFRRTADSKGVLLRVADLGFQGTGTVTLRFFVEMQTAQQTLSMATHISLNMHNDAPFTFTRQAAEGQVDVQTSRFPQVPS